MGWRRVAAVISHRAGDGDQVEEQLRIRVLSWLERVQKRTQSARAATTVTVVALASGM
jgi:hypothetical protein